MKATKGYAVHSATDTLAPWNFERRELRPHDILISISYCGVCHTDLHQVRGDWGNSMYPMVPGHEIVGRVAGVGSEVTKYKEGDLVGVGCFVDSCRVCENCKNHQEQFCLVHTVWTYNSYERDNVTIAQGGYSNQIVTDEAYVLRVSESLPLEGVAPLLCAGITTYSPLKKWKVGPGHKIGVVGLGGLGHMAVKLAVSMGAEVTMLSTSPSKQADAQRLGAVKFVNTQDKSQVNSIHGYFDFIFDTIAVPHDYDMYLKMMHIDGVMICAGLPTEAIKASPFILGSGNRTITGTWMGGIEETQEMLDYCAERNITSDVEVINMNYVNEAYERLIKNDVKYRFVIDMKTL